jgi:hypothetical protein
MSEDTASAPNAFVAETATARGGLALGALVLVGIYGEAEARRALLRDRTGALLPVTVGDATPRGTVVAISQDGVHLARAGLVTEVLGLPGE